MAMPKARAHEPGHERGRPNEISSDPAREQDRGRLADTPSEIPARGWWDILLRIYGNYSRHRVLALAAGITYFSLLAIFPALAALVAIYGLPILARSSHLDQLSGILPQGALDVARDRELARNPAIDLIVADFAMPEMNGVDLARTVNGLRPSLPFLSPIEQGRVLRHVTLKTIAKRQGATPAQVALAWVLRQDGVCAIPESGNPEHVRDNRGALDVRLTPEDLADLDESFPPPDRKQRLAAH